MGTFINWWCNLIGVTDPVSIQIAGGLIAVTCLYIGGLVLWTIFLWLVALAIENF
jgi:hypothetical protein